MTPPLVSVLVPAFNSSAYIRTAVDSVLGQTMGNLELVVVDDQSTDGTYEILHEYGDARMRLLRNERNLGAAANWNRVVKEARGRYIKLLCADDVLYPTCLQKQVAVLEDPVHRHVALVGCLRDIIDEHDQKLMVRGGFGRAGPIPAREVLTRIVRTGTNLIGEPAAVLFRAEAIVGAGSFDESLPYLIDLDMWCKLLSGGDFYAQDEPLAAFRVSRTAWSALLAREQGKQGRQFLRRMRQYWAPWVSSGDVLRGSALATVNAYLRQVMYLVFMRPTFRRVFRLVAPR